MSKNVRIVESADVSDKARIGEGSSVWHLAQIREDAELGRNCIIGRGAYIGTGVVLGDNCKVQNYALVYEPARLADGVFIGPAVVLTNDHYPRAINSDGSAKSASDWEAVGVSIETGASIGANSTCVAPLRIGRWALIGSGSTVIRDVPDFAIVVGTPARRVGWAGKEGHPLKPGDEEGIWVCPVSGERYVEEADTLKEES